VSTPNVFGENSLKESVKFSSKTFIFEFWRFAMKQIWILVFILFLLPGASLIVAELPTNIEVSTLFTAPDFDNPGDNSYTPVWSFNGSTYFVWMDKNWKPWVTKITGSSSESVPLDANTSDPYTALGSDGHHKFSMGIDNNGYIHITGDMHNYPGHDGHMPQRYQGNIIMYWISNSPESLMDGFRYIGDDPDKAMNGHTFTYGAFYADKYGKLYYRTRCRAVVTNPPSHFSGEMGVCIYKHDIAAQSWTALGTTAPMTKSGADFHNVVTWANTGQAGGWYQGFRGTMRFDDNNRLHYSEPITGIKDKEPTHIIYAYSDDEGESFHRADGSMISLPIQPSEGESQPSIVDSYDNGSGVLGGHDIHTGAFVDANNNPAVTFKRNEGDKKAGFRYWKPESGSWSDIITPAVGASIREMHYLHPSGFLIFISNGSGKITVAESFEDEGRTYDTGFDTFRSVDERGLRTNGILRASGEKDGKLHVIQVDFPGVDAPDYPGPDSSVTEIESLSLIDANSEQVLYGYEDLSLIDTIELESLNTDAQNVFANISGSVDSVVFSFDLNGQVGHHKEQVFPYGLRGDGSGYDHWSMEPGSYSLSASVYFRGVLQDTQSVSFVVTENHTSIFSSSQLSGSLFLYNREQSLLYLNPGIELNPNFASIEIYDISGSKVLYRRLETPQKTISISTSSLQSGLYFLKYGSNSQTFVK